MFRTTRWSGGRACARYGRSAGHPEVPRYRCPCVWTYPVSDGRSEAEEARGSHAAGHRSPGSAGTSAAGPGSRPSRPGAGPRAASRPPAAGARPRSVAARPGPRPQAALPVAARPGSRARTGTPDVTGDREGRPRSAPPRLPTRLPAFPVRRVVTAICSVPAGRGLGRRAQGGQDEQVPPGRYAASGGPVGPVGPAGARARRASGPRSPAGRTPNGPVCGDGPDTGWGAARHRRRRGQRTARQRTRRRRTARASKPLRVVRP